MDQIATVNLVVGGIGFVLIIVALTMAFSLKYYSIFTNSYFAEPWTKEQKDRLGKEIYEKSKSERYTGSLLLLVMGLSALFWAFEVIQAFPFFALATFGFVMVAINFVKSRGKDS